MKLSVRVGQTVETMGQSDWRAQVAQVDFGGDFPEKIRLMIAPDANPLASGEYAVELSRAVKLQNVIVDGKRPGQRVSRPMLVIDVRAEDLVAVKVAPKAVNA